MAPSSSVASSKPVRSVTRRSTSAAAWTATSPMSSTTSPAKSVVSPIRFIVDLPFEISALNVTSVRGTLETVDRNARRLCAQVLSPRELVDRVRVESSSIDLFSDLVRPETDASSTTSSEHFGRGKLEKPGGSACHGGKRPSRSSVAPRALVDRYSGVSPTAYPVILCEHRADVSKYFSASSTGLRIPPRGGRHSPMGGSRRSIRSALKPGGSRDGGGPLREWLG